MQELNENLIKEIHDVVLAIEPHDEIEALQKSESLAWINSGENIFRIKKPDIPPKHLVSYFVLVDHEHKSLLLVDHIKAQLWLPSGGHVELNEHPKVTVEREVKEELGIKAVFLKNYDRPFFITATKTVGLTAGHVDVSLWYLLKGSVHDFLNFDKREFNDIEWFSFDEILKSDLIIFDPNMHRFTQKLIKHLA
ncbi:MAG TPA: NUDIX domain-containing protein [Candidatus Saccharimonadales bacterium]|nr:NUDIX domain-containing protein [Candidatus Saccharimonadales bacterium]